MRVGLIHLRTSKRRVIVRERNPAPRIYHDTITPRAM
jgi:hypothetical protein